jgi:hypothetical protein
MDSHLNRANLLKPGTKQGREGCATTNDDTTNDATTNDATTKCFYQQNQDAKTNTDAKRNDVTTKCFYQ